MKQPSRDYYLISHINSHYDELKKAFSKFETLESFSNSGPIRKAILFDFLQIGELLNHLSDSFAISFGEEELGKAVSIRNHIVHGYDTVDDEKVFLTIKNNLPNFIESLNKVAVMRYKSTIDNLVGTKIKIYHDIDEDKFYTNNLTTLKGRFQPVILKDTNKSFCDGDSAVVESVAQGELEDALIVSFK